MLTEWVTEITLPRRGPSACMHLCTSGNATCKPGTTGCSCTLPAGYGAGAVGNVLLSDDCSGVPPAFKSWIASQQAPGWWQFASSSDGTCLTVNTADYIAAGYGCEWQHEPASGGLENAVPGPQEGRGLWRSVGVL